MIKLYAYAAGAIALVALSAFGYHAIYSSGKTAGEALIQTQWDANKEAIQKTTDAAIAQAIKARDDALQANEGVKNDYEAQLLAANANAAVFAQRLRNYQAHPSTDRGTVPKAGSGPAAPATGASGGDGTLTNALGDALAECSANTAQLDALIIELKPQL